MDDADLNSFPVKVLINQAEFDRIHDDTRFRDFLELGRISNSISFLYCSVLERKDDSSPVGIRQKFRAFVFIIGVLHEALKTIDTLQDKYRTADYFQNGFGTWISDRRVKKFRKNFLENTRNQLSFHFGSSVMTETIEAGFNLPEYVLVSANSDKGIDLFFELSESIEYDYIVKSYKENEDKLKAMGLIYERIAEITVNITRSTDLFLTGLSKEMQIQAVKGPYSKNEVDANL